ncbi:DUF4828 domain-containing protein [Ligilactobacillus sp. Marseille-Q7487]|uniref:DUF4828 domain-containing protein n=1 Tax=Ligilactobacillus sp. Marseille-Q7487 TaxID=3022128 RepID=UPI0024A84F06|nr:DUF4828 domain-containing protein [Ligilactobacillus sp. Marseille-Q7487]
MKRKGLTIIGGITPLVTGIGKMVHTVTKKRASVKPALPLIYAGTWMFTDELSHKVHQLEISVELTIALDGRQLLGKVEQLDSNELVFLDNYGYHLRISAVNNLPVSVFDEADNRVYELYAPEVKKAELDEE